MEHTACRGPLLPARIIHNRTVNNVWDGVLTLAAFLIVTCRWEIIGALIFLGLVGVMLILSDRLSDIWIPLILMTVFLTRCYDSYDTFIRFAPFVAVVIAAVFFHIIYYWAKPKIGASFPGLCAVTVAVTFGGLFSISAADYFRPMTLYYVSCLGILMPVLYLVAKPRANGEARERFLRGLFLAGCLAVYSVAVFYAESWPVFLATHRITHFQSSNNLATFLMIAMPTGFFAAKSHRWLIVSPAIMYFAILLCDSRSGILFGSMEFLLLLIFFCFYRADLFRRIFCISCLVTFVVLLAVFLPKAIVFYEVDLVIRFSPDMTVAKLLDEIDKFLELAEPRLRLIPRAFADFRSNPLFGVGLGYRGNSDLYNPVKGAMNWYHMWGPQILGSMGILGVLCYGYQLFGRIKLAFSRRGLQEVTLSLCYLGLFLMSQVNPGEFCPFPYAITATLIFILIEPNEQAEHEKTAGQEPTVPAAAEKADDE